MIAVPDSLQDVVCHSLSTAGLHPSTDPESIADEQRRIVSLFFYWNPTATLADASDALDLPVWSIEVRWAELSGEPVPYHRNRPKPKTRGQGNEPYFAHTKEK